MKSKFRIAYYIQVVIFLLSLLGGMLLLHFYDWPAYELDLWKLLGSGGILILVVAWYAEYLHSCKALELYEDKIVVKTPVLNTIRKYNYSDINSFDSKIQVSKVAKLKVVATQYPIYLIIFDDGIEASLSPNIFSNYSEVLKHLRERMSTAANIS